MPRMTKADVKEVLDRVLSRPEDRQQEAASMLMVLEAQEGELYHPSDDEWAAIEEGYAQDVRSEFVADEDMVAFWKRLRP